MTLLALCGLAPSLAATRVRRARNARCGAAVRVAAAAGPDGAAPATVRRGGAVARGAPDLR